MKFFSVALLFLVCSRFQLFADIGDKDNPHQISSVRDFYELSQNPDAYSDYFELTGDIDFKECETVYGESGFLPFGFFSLDSVEEFSGHFDGSGYSLKNIKLDAVGRDYFGLFAYLNGALIEDLRIENIKIENGDSYIGGIAGFAENSEIDECQVSGRIEGNFDTGSIVGYSQNTEITQSFSSAVISAEESVGGIVGTCKYSEVSECFFSGALNGDENTGGIAGYCSNSSIDNSYSKGAVIGDIKAGGIIGTSSKSQIEKCFVSGRLEYESSESIIAGYSEKTDFSNCVVDVSTVCPEKSNYAHAIGIKYLTGEELFRRVSYTDYSFGPVWRIKEGEGRPFLEYEEVGISNSSVAGNTVGNLFCSVADFADSEVIEFGFTVTSNPNLYESRFFNISGITIPENSSFAYSNLIIYGLSNTASLWGAAYAINDKYKLSYGDRIKFIFNDSGAAVGKDNHSGISLNVTNEVLRISSTAEKISKVEIFDTSGNLLRYFDRKEGREQSYDISCLSNGFYFINIIRDNDKSVVTFPVVILR